VNLISEFGVSAPAAFGKADLKLLSSPPPSACEKEVIDKKKEQRLF